MNLESHLKYRYRHEFPRVRTRVYKKIRNNIELLITGKYVRHPTRPIENIV